VRTQARGRGLQELEREDGRPAGSPARGRRRKGVEVCGVRARVQGRETVRSLSGRLEGDRAGGWRECASKKEGDRRGTGEAGEVSDASGRPAEPREGGRR
jgi:hypothetical protein